MSKLARFLEFSRQILSSAPASAPTSTQPVPTQPPMVGTSRCYVPARVPAGGTAGQACPPGKFVPSPDAALGDGDGAARRSLPASQSQSGSKKQNQGIDGSFARHGKIARLLAVLREGLNRALARGISGPQVLEWLNRQPGTQAVLRQHFNDQPISLQNLSQWRRGGFRDWLLQQEARQVFEEFAAVHHELTALELNETMALWLGARIVVMARRIERQDPEESWPVVRQMVRDVSALRRGDHRIREQKFKEGKKQEITHEEHLQWAMQPGRLEWLCKQAGDNGNDAITEQLGEMMFGDHWHNLGPAPEKFPGVQQPLPPDKPKTQHLPSPGSSPLPKGGIQTAADQGNTKEIKADQSESKCDLPTAAKPQNAKNQTPPPAAETPNSKNQIPNKPSASALAGPVAPVGIIGPVEKSEASPTSTTAVAPAPQPLTGPGITFTKRPQHYINICECGARNQIPLSECEVCMRKVRFNEQPCLCH